MSTPLAIATITAALRNLIQPVLEDEDASAKVTTVPPDKANEAQGETDGGNRINLFLYQTEINETFRNMDLPDQVKPGERGYSPLALNLYYLITAYNKKHDDIEAHKLLGIAMGTLHDYPFLSPNLLKNALPEANVHNQLERVRVTPQPLSSEDMSKLWTTFQTQYRISAAYQVSAVLIDSTRQVEASLPVLRRGPEDEGVHTQANMIPPFPTLTAVKPPRSRKQRPTPTLELGDKFVLEGHHLDGQHIEVWCRHSRMSEWLGPLTLDANKSTDETLTLQLPAPGSVDAPNSARNYWLAGFYTLKAVFFGAAGEPEKETNELSVALAPKLENLVAVSHNADYWRVSCGCIPSVLPQQSIYLLLGDSPVTPETFGTTSGIASHHPVMQFLVSKNSRLKSGQDNYVRLRVDGVDSLLVKDYSAELPAFDPQQKVTLP